MRPSSLSGVRETRCVEWPGLVSAPEKYEEGSTWGTLVGEAEPEQWEGIQLLEITVAFDHVS